MIGFSLESMNTTVEKTPSGMSPANTTVAALAGVVGLPPEAEHPVRLPRGHAVRGDQDVHAVLGVQLVADRVAAGVVGGLVAAAVLQADRGPPAGGSRHGVQGDVAGAPAGG